MALCVLLLALLLFPSPARAHTVNLSQGTLALDDAHAVTLELAFAAPDHERLGGGSLVTVVDAKGNPCREEVADTRNVEDGIVVRVHAECEGAVKKVDFVFWPRLDARHRLLLRAEGRDVLVDATSPQFVLHEATPQRTKNALQLGFEHVALGYDHLLFLFGLALASTVAGEKRRRLFLAVTAFTLTHTAALAVAFHGTISIPERPVEVLIACTIGFVGLEIFRNPRRGANPLACAAFGCVHGLGFGTAFRGALGTTSPGTLVLATLGVEAAQVLGVAIALGILWLPGIRLPAVRRSLAAALFVVGLALAAIRAFG